MTQADLYLLHQPYGDVAGVWKALEEAKAEGKLHSIGMSNMTPKIWKEFVPQFKTIPAVNQVECNPFFQQKELCALLEQDDVRLKAYQPLGHGNAERLSHPRITKLLTGCSNNHGAEKNFSVEGVKGEPKEEKREKLEMKSSSDSIEADTGDSAECMEIEPETVDVDWSEYFNGLNGTAVVYDVSNRRYIMHNRDLALTRRPPCSTFKIISFLIALENGIIMPENSTRDWSGEIFWNEDWNKDIDFSEAFRTSCVWYYRQVIDDIG